MAFMGGGQCPECGHDDVHNDELIKELVATRDGREALSFIMEEYADEEKRPKLVSEYEFLLSKVDNINQLTDKELYNLLNDFDSKDKEISDELIAYSIGYEAEVIEDLPTTKLKRIIKKIFDWIRAKLFGPVWTSNIYARSLDPNMSYTEIARLLVNSDRKFTLERPDMHIIKEQYAFTPRNR